MMNYIHILDLNVVLTAEEASLIRSHGLYNRLPYNTTYTRTLVDGIASKLGLVKRFRGPRRIHKVSRYNECLKHDAVAVKLYRKANFRRYGSGHWKNPTPKTVVSFFLDDQNIGAATYYLKELHDMFEA